MNSGGAVATCKAWLLPVHGDVHVAVGEQVLVHVVSERVRAVTIPRSPRWCRSLFVWQGQIIPIFQFGSFLNPAADMQAQATAGMLIAILAFSDAGGVTRYGGMRLTALPVKRGVSDDQACDLPAEFPGWKRVAAACFDDALYGPVPVLELAGVFCAPPGTLLPDVATPE